jgi:hypothetical protein
MTPDSTHNKLVDELEAVLAHIEEAARDASTARTAGILNSLRVMLAPSIGAAHLLRATDIKQTTT